jgi:hypothetical protein
MTTPPPAIPPAPAEPPTAPTKRRIKPITIGFLLGIAVGAAIVGGTWGFTTNSGSDTNGKPDAKGRAAVDILHSDPDTFTLDGSFELTDGAIDDGIGGCEGTGGYDDIAEGTSVTVYDAAGAVIATGSLGSSTYELSTCTFDVSVPDVPKGEDFYKVEVSHRGTVQLSAEEAEAGQFGASLG